MKEERIYKGRGNIFLRVENVSVSMSSLRYQNFYMSISLIVCINEVPPTIRIFFWSEVRRALA